MVFVYFLSLLLHTLVGWSLLPDFVTSQPVYASLVGCVLVLSGIALPMGLFAHRLTKPPLADVLNWFGLLCMGLFSTLAVLTLVREVLLILTDILVWLIPDLILPSAMVSRTAMAVPVVSLVATLLGLVNARRSAKVVSINVPIANLPKVLEGFTVVQISDVHVVRSWLRVQNVSV